MKDIINIEKGLWEIARILSSDENLQRLLIDDTYDLSDKNFTPKMLNELIKDKYINIYPYTESGIKDFTRNTFLIVLPTTINFTEDDNSIAFFSVFVWSDINHIILSDCRHRILQIVNLVTKDLDGRKLSAAGELRVQTISRSAVDSFHEVYRIDLRFSDQISEEERFDI